MLLNKEDGYKYMQFSNQKAHFVCPNCGVYIGECYINNVSKVGLSCPRCSSGITYPNKLMYNLLNSLCEDFDTEITFDWCTFPDFYDSSKMSYGRYDFVLENKKIIIEMDGGFGHGNSPHPRSRYSKEELIYKDNMKDDCAVQNGYKVIRIDCNYRSYDRLKYCSDSILSSQLSSIFNLTSVDWDKIHYQSMYFYNNRKT